MNIPLSPSVKAFIFSSYTLFCHSCARLTAQPWKHSLSSFDDYTIMFDIGQLAPQAINYLGHISRNDPYKSAATHEGGIV